ncbi:MAG: 16S rRNA (uracil(1498)-N(3))-methyltransferase [Corynebacterium sp.]|uniref:16S rRNA (uracil(1498)-N(3))-methyltransferase n=1 Tax=Corynebacterium sp. TaxID=1720 RepID=UPI0026DC1B66|nr:16S rRNA (uracil(1498)-N(3))-methyltransferase [Corynebacterium sp.]MDO5029768.1 16S rRNA (uracil(1498)-N(3))-methyltransferase [Corynebacterium sp.]
MSLPVFLGDFSELPRVKEVLRIHGPEAKHISVRRLKEGQEVLLANGADLVVRARLMHVDPREVHAQVLHAEKRPRPLPHVTVVQALPKSDRAELAVDLMTEIGVDEIIPWAALNCVARWNGSAKETKARAKWQAAAREAAKQARRAWIPPVAALHSSADIEQLIESTVADGGVAAVLHEEETAPFVEFAAKAADASKVLFIVGPEGGVSPAELEAFTAAGASSVVLGPTVLRSALAGAAAISALGPLTGRWATDGADNSDAVDTEDAS